LRLIGLDDTDDAWSRGTGFRARGLAAVLEADGLATALGVTRHQLLVDPRIPYTSHNSAACLVVRPAGADDEALAERCRSFLSRSSAPGADAGFCVADARGVDAAVLAFGRAAKERVVGREDASALARSAALRLEAVTGDGGGVIGALAAVGLRSAGDDGRFLWLPGLRELAGTHAAGALRELAGIEEVRTLDGRRVPAGDRVNAGDWPRPVLLGGRPVLLVEEETDDTADWRSVPRDVVRSR
jgi:hypothetical protein